MKKIGIIICDRYNSCAGGKCFRSMHNREGAFSIYKNEDIEIAAYTTCGGCPGGNIEYTIDEMKKNGVTHVHFATGMIVGYPPCPYITYFHDFIEKNWNVTVIYGTHPIPEKYLDNHRHLKSWQDPVWQNILKLVMSDQQTRINYN
ncbi:MAG: CGGC domain-containing protein [Candidatus Marinimicrobia bacterium]|nr:CGGC domain-containing protein [Candidatus Neomarinimicrobiota bacterium]